MPAKKPAPAQPKPDLTILDERTADQVEKCFVYLRSILPSPEAERRARRLLLEAFAGVESDPMGFVPSVEQAVALERFLATNPGAAMGFQYQCALARMKHRDAATSPAVAAAPTTASDPDAELYDKLPDRAKACLAALLGLAAVDVDHRKPRHAVEADAAGEVAETKDGWGKDAWRELTKHTLIESKTGRGGGAWLTPRGRALAERFAPPT